MSVLGSQQPSEGHEPVGTALVRAAAVAPALPSTVATAAGPLTAPVRDARGLAPAPHVFEPVGDWHPDAYPARHYLDHVVTNDATRRAMRQALDVVAGLLSAGRADALGFPWARLTYDVTSSLPNRLAAEGYARTSVQKILSAVRGALKEAWRLERIGVEEYRRAADVQLKRATKLPPSTGRRIESRELRVLFDVCATDEGPAGERDAAILAVLYAGGLRRSEVVALNVGDYNRETGALEVLDGKGGTDRVVYLAGEARAALVAWLDGTRATLPRGPWSPLFLPINRHRRAYLRRLTDQAIYVILRKRAAEGRILAALAPHDFRRTFISDLLESGADLAVAQQLAGHANPATTARYDRRGEKAKREAAARLHVPYTGRRVPLPS